MFFIDIFNTIAASESAICVHFFNTFIRFIMVLLHCCFTIAVVSACGQNLVLLFWSLFSYIFWQTDYCMIVKSSLGVLLLSRLNYKWIIFYTALLKITISPFLKMLNHKIILMRKMDASIDNRVISLWNISCFTWAKSLISISFI